MRPGHAMMAVISALSLRLKDIGPNPNNGSGLGDDYPGGFSKEFETAVPALHDPSISQPEIFLFFA